MGSIRTAFECANPANRSLSPITANARVDTGAVHLCLPEHLAIQLDLKELEQREVTLANGRFKGAWQGSPACLCWHAERLSADNHRTLSSRRLWPRPVFN